jgi:hypothetical protein
MSDLERVVTEAQQAREEAEAAARRAAELEGQAEIARERARQEEAERRRQWAQRIVDTYDADISAADAAIQQAHEHFNTVAVQNLSGAVEAYTAWGEASMRHYALQLRVSAAAEMLDLGTSPPEFVTPPTFSDALDAALAEALRERTRTVDQEFEDELARLSEGAPASATP